MGLEEILDGIPSQPIAQEQDTQEREEIDSKGEEFLYNNIITEHSFEEEKIWKPIAQCMKLVILLRILV